MRTCVNCKEDCLKIAGRGLCAICYRFHSRRGTLDQFPGAYRSSEDVKYSKWLLSEPRVPAETIKPWIDILIAEHETLQQAVRGLNIDNESVRRIWNGRWASAKYSVAEEIAVAAGRMVELAMAMPDVGVEGWSEHGRYCGDDSPLGHPGCGSWFHKHEMDGLCEECLGIALGLVDMETRDIRVTREKGEAAWS